MKRKAIHNKDFKINKMLRAVEQREAMKKTSPKSGGDKQTMTYHGGLHKVTV